VALAAHARCGRYGSVSEIGDAENISKLAPDLIEAILAGSADSALMLGQRERPLPLSWEEERTLLKPCALCLP
jgi:hypothetical protein